MNSITGDKCVQDQLAWMISEITIPSHIISLLNYMFLPLQNSTLLVVEELEDSPYHFKPTHKICHVYGIPCQLSNQNVWPWKKLKPSIHNRHPDQTVPIFTPSMSCVLATTGHKRYTLHLHGQWMESILFI